MKHSGRLVDKLAVSGVALLVACLVSTADAQTQSCDARVSSLKGSADYSSGGGTWMSLKGVKMLKAGDTLRTDDTGNVVLDLGKSGTLRVMPNTTLVIDKLTMERTGADTVVETQLDLKNGRILGNVPKLAAASKYEVKTPHAVAGIRGTKYDISQNGCVVVVEGTVVVVCVKPDNTTLTRVVNTAERFCCDTGVVEPAPREILEESRRNIPPLFVGGPVFIPGQPIQPPLSPVTPGTRRETRDHGD